MALRTNSNPNRSPLATVSVLIPAYNAAKTIDATLRSVLAQTRPPDQIIVVDDGSTDDTSRRLKAYLPRIIVVSQANCGVAVTRNILFQHSTGDVLAYLDADDLWHPQYLEFQLATLTASPSSVASFTNHINLQSDGDYDWAEKFSRELSQTETIQSAEFIRRYNRDPSLFGSPSFCCLLKSALGKIGPAPFPTSLRLAEDYYVMNLLPFFGTILFTPVPLVAYRETIGSLTSNKLTAVKYAVEAFELLRPHYDNSKAAGFKKIFYDAFASKQREFAKYLMGAGQVSDARHHLKSSWKKSDGLSSFAKSIALYFLTFLPSFLQPKWPSRVRA